MREVQKIKTGNSSLRRVLAASLIGNALEWYDYIIYGSAAALIFPKVFFPESSQLIGTISAFATFAAGFLVRPIGAIFAGYFGDRFGRKTMLLATIIIMGVCSAAVGLIPGYESIGFWAPVLLTITRLLQGFAIGGEWSGAILLAIEQQPGGKKKGLLGSFPQTGNALGLLLATGVFSLFSTIFSERQFSTWGWRIPFLLSIVLVVVGVLLRYAIDETPEFLQNIEHNTPERFPLLSVVKSQPRNFFLSMGSRLGVDIAFYVFTTYAISYGATVLSLPTNTVQIGLLIGAFIGMFTMPLFGSLSDKIGIKKVYISGLVFFAIYGFIFFALIDTKSVFLTWVALIIAYAIGIAWGWAPFAGFMATLFPAKYRYSATGFSFQFAGIFGGSLAPTIATLLYSSTGSSESIAMYLLVASIISIVCSALLKPVNEEV